MFINHTLRPEFLVFQELNAVNDCLKQFVISIHVPTITERRLKMKLNPNSKHENKLLSLRQFIESLREQYVFAIEIVNSDKDQITIQLLREDL